MCACPPGRRFCGLLTVAPAVSAPALSRKSDRRRSRRRVRRSPSSKLSVPGGGGGGSLSKRPGRAGRAAACAATSHPRGAGRGAALVESERPGVSSTPSKGRPTPSPGPPPTTPSATSRPRPAPPLSPRRASRRSPRAEDPGGAERSVSGPHPLPRRGTQPRAPRQPAVELGGDRRCARRRLARRTRRGRRDRSASASTPCVRPPPTRTSQKAELLPGPQPQLHHGHPRDRREPVRGNREFASTRRGQRRQRRPTAPTPSPGRIVSPRPL